MNNTVVIIDGNSVCHAAHNGPKLNVGGMQTQAIFGMIKSVKKVMIKFPGCKYLVLWDGRAQWRYDAYPDYKGNREAVTAEEAAEKDHYKLQSPFVRRALSLLGVRQMFATYAEADDMAGFFTKRMVDAGKNVVLVTRDWDWMQLVSPQVSWFSPIDDLMVSHMNFTATTGYFSTNAYVQGKALIGDSSDTIKGVAGIGKAKAPMILAQFGSVGNFHDMCDRGEFKPKLKIHESLNSAEGREVFARNMKLMDLRNVQEPPVDEINIIKPDYNEEKFRHMCDKLAFRSFTRDLHHFLQPFEVNQ